MEKRTFAICDDESENCYDAKFVRTKNQVKPFIWAMPIGGYVAITDVYGKPTNRAYFRIS